MYIVLVDITIQQIPTTDYPNRNLLLHFPYLVNYEGQSSWQSLTQTLTLTIPKKTYLKVLKQDGTPTNQLVRLFNTFGSNSNLGGYVGIPSPAGNVPTIMRGDVITVNVGYTTYLNGSDGRKVTYLTGTNDPTAADRVTVLPPLFKGYISNVNPAMPFTISCEDNMWLLKQVPTPTTQKRWTNKNLQTIVQEILDEAKTLPNISKYNVDLTVSKFSLTDLVFNVGNFWTRGESLAAVLIRIKQQYKLDSYFRGNELRIGLTHYIPDDNKRHVFTFQKNIIEDNLNYQRKDDINLSMIVRSHYRVLTGHTTKDGGDSSKQASTEILIYRDPKTFAFKYTVKKPGEPFFKKNDIDVSGKRFDYEIYDAITDTERLFQMGLKELQKYYYNGLRGSFVTFGIPYVKHGDSVQLIDNVLPERNGIYMVRSVKYAFGVDSGLRQEIELDYRTDIS